MVRYAAAAFALAITSLGLSAHGAEILLLDFWSPHCSPCMQMKPTVHALEQARYPIREVDTTREPQMSQQFNVDRIPCFVMLVDGKEVDREIGFTSSERLQQMFQKAKDEVVKLNGVSAQSPDRLVAAQIQRPAAEAPAMPAPQASPSNGQSPAAGDPWSLGANDKPRVAVGDPARPGTELPTNSNGPATDFPPSLIAATVRIRVEDAQGNSFGTGTIIDSRSGEALIVTCGHLFRESKGKGAMTVELFEAGPSGARVAGQVPGQLISFDLERDVALVAIHPGRPVSAAPVAPPRTAIGRGDRVATIGCSNGKDPTLLAQRITTLDRYQGPANIEVSGAPEEGRSGGGLFNLQGQLIGVCYAADYEGNEGLYAALDSIHGELDRLGLKEVYTRNEAPSKAGDNLDTASGPTVVRGQEPLAPLTPIPSSTSQVGATVPVTPVDAKAGPLKDLVPAEQAALEEIKRRASTSEVICIVRPKEPGAQSEVISLGEVSPEFVRALAEQTRSPQAPVSR